MRKTKFFIRGLIMAMLATGICSHAIAGNTTKEKSKLPQSKTYAGSVSCRECHEKFYQLWATSRHGLAMQPYTADFAVKQLSAQQNDIVIGKYKYRADISPKAGYVLETGPKGEKKYKIEHVLGGKNVFYFLTLLEKGRLQTLPVAYDVNRKEWLDTAASGMRHIPGELPNQPVHWKDWPYTFNTACYSCHVSQLATNYDLKKDTYSTRWAEPGINCETCHGPSGEHIKIAKATPKGQPLTKYGLIRTKIMTKVERNDLCSSCHAKGSPITTSFMSGDRFLDHFDLVTLEDADFYPDGRDLGENYTFTSWRMSPCAKSGNIDCMHCHTSSGRYRFKKENFNDSCMPCHEDKVKNPTEHTHHSVDSEAGKCVSCHMPMTEFARMKRSDHSMLPPTPAATIAFKSPNACNNCHADKDAVWADKIVRQWRTRDYQAPVLKRARLIDAARKSDWSSLPEMLDYISNKERDEIFATSIIRLLPMSRDKRVQQVLLAAMKDPSPLVRSAAAEELGLIPSTESLQALIQATGDDYRLVRVRAAAALSPYPGMISGGEYSEKIKKATEEYLASIMARPDQWTAHYNMGNFLLSRKELDKAIESYNTALKREPRAVMAMVNTSLAHAQKGENDKAEKSLKQALAIAPDSAAANFNMGLLMAEQKDIKEAEKYLRNALKADPRMAEAAYNLCVLLANDRLDEGIDFCRKASELRSDEPKYSYTLGFYQQQKGDSEGAIKTLDALLAEQPAYLDAYLLLAGIFEKQGKKTEAKKVYNRALSLENTPDEFNYFVRKKMEAVK